MLFSLLPHPLIHFLVQLRAFLEISGAVSFFGASGAEEVMKIFDSDGFVSFCSRSCTFMRMSFLFTPSAATDI